MTRNKTLKRKGKVIKKQDAEKKGEVKKKHGAQRNGAKRNGARADVIAQALSIRLHLATKVIA